MLARLVELEAEIASARSDIEAAEAAGDSEAATLARNREQEALAAQRVASEEALADQTARADSNE